MSILYFIISFFSSVVGAISGIGGGVIIKPVLDSIGGFPVATISFLSGSTVLSMTTVALIKSRKSEIQVETRTAGLLAAGGIAGGMIGKYIFDIIRSSFENDMVLGVSQSGILLLLTVLVFFYTLFKENIPPRHQKGLLFIASTGLILGGLATFLGIGGGPINLAVLCYFFSMDSKTAALNSIFVIFFSQVTSLLFTALAGNIPPFEPAVLLLMILGGISGGLLGSRLSARMSHRAVDRLFMGVMAIIIGICVYNILKWFL
ncbi:MAG: sulfite exporter TauE/SafE family protein [Spirochaetales bacterium]|nr:sulfite exporter TauE/SafE family protein [Spirochaetales bacterium]